MLVKHQSESFIQWNKPT